MRYAIYFTPPQEDALTRRAARWLGRDAFTGERLDPAGENPPGEALTAEPRRYGFHATLRAPFRLRAGVDESGLVAAMQGFAVACAPVIVPRMALARLDGFFALVPAAPAPALDALAAGIVRAFDRFAAPLSEADIARRRPESLDPAERDYLHRWGYPYVFDRFRFHMTLTGRVPDGKAQDVRAAIEAHFGALLEKPLEIGALTLFVEPEPGAPFAVRATAALGRKTAARKFA